MMAKELQDWFPEAQISDQPVKREGYLTLPLASQQWILLEEASLSEREKQLVALLTKQEQTISLNPWYPYLIEGKGQAPKTFKKIQLVYCHLSYFQQENLASWLDMMRTLFSQLSDGDSGRSSGLCFRASARQIHICTSYFK